MAQQDDVNAALDRLDKLERQNVRLRLWLVLLGGMTAVMFLWLLARDAPAGWFGQAKPPPDAEVTLKAGKFVLVDAAGRERAVLASADGAPELVFLDVANTRRLTLGLAKTGDPGLGLLDEKGKAKVILMAAGPRTGLALWDAKDQDRLFLGLDGTVPALQLWDAKGEQRGLLAVTAGGPEFSLWD